MALVSFSEFYFILVNHMSCNWLKYSARVRQELCHVECIHKDIPCNGASTKCQYMMEYHVESSPAFLKDKRRAVVNDTSPRSVKGQQHWGTPSSPYTKWISGRKPIVKQGILLSIFFWDWEFIFICWDCIRVMQSSAFRNLESSLLANT